VIDTLLDVTVNIDKDLVDSVIISKNLTPIPVSKIRYVDINTESYEVARKYMIRLEKEDLEDDKKLRKINKVTNISAKEFREYSNNL